MIELRKLVVFLFVLSLFVYMIWINLKFLNKVCHKKSLFFLMISGLGLILAGTFFDVISNFIDTNFRNLISICFTVGAMAFVIYIILWSSHIAETICNLSECAYNDKLTGVYNRSGFEKVFKSRIAMKKKFYVLVFDLDKTKTINDNFGHLKGDEYIVNAALIIKDEIGTNGFVGRTGGDEFVAFLENVSKEEIDNIKLSIKERVSHIFNKEKTHISIGYSKYKEDGETYEELLNYADKRMYEDKENKRKYKLKQCNFN